MADEGAAIDGDARGVGHDDLGALAADLDGAAQLRGVAALKTTL